MISLKKNTTELVFILDRSGSMGGLEQDTIGGYNTLIEKQKKEEGVAYLTTVLFDDQYDIIHDRVDIHQVAPLTNKEYFPRGMTALLDAVGKTILRISKMHQELDSSEVPENTLVVITTDGYENASKLYNYSDIKTLIAKQKEIYNWEFLFLGANIDAKEEASKFGIKEDKAINYHADNEGVKKHYKEISKTVSHYRATSQFQNNWRDEMDKDYKGRNRK